MTRLLRIVALSALAIAPAAAQAAPPAMSALSMGGGPHGYDFLIGSWTCRNSTATQAGGPVNQTLTFARSDAGAIYVRVTGKDFDGAGFISYNPKTKVWSNPFALADGSYEDESSTETGSKVSFTGPFVASGSGKAQQVRDTFTRTTATTYTDLNEYQAGTTWKTQFTSSCKKS